MPITDFLSELFEHGQVTVAVIATGAKPRESFIDARQRGAIASSLVSAEEVHRLSGPPGLPPFHLDTAIWAATWFHGACQALVSRHLSGEEVAVLLQPPASEKGDASAHYSADLTLRYLPDLVRLCRGLSSEDPLLAPLTQVANAWPLSLAGTPGAVAAADPARLEMVLAHPALRRVYVERILAAGDVTRLADPRCRDEAMTILGACRELAGPAVINALWPVNGEIGLGKQEARK